MKLDEVRWSYSALALLWDKRLHQSRHHSWIFNDIQGITSAASGQAQNCDLWCIMGTVLLMPPWRESLLYNAALPASLNALATIFGGGNGGYSCCPNHILASLLHHRPDPRDHDVRHVSIDMCKTHCLLQAHVTIGNPVCVKACESCKIKHNRFFPSFLVCSLKGNVHQKAMVYGFQKSFKILQVIEFNPQLPICSWKHIVFFHAITIGKNQFMQIHTIKKTSMSCWSSLRLLCSWIMDLTLASSSGFQALALADSTLLMAWVTSLMPSWPRAICCCRSSLAVSGITICTCQRINAKNISPHQK